MRILIACDSFKDALGADAVCRAIAGGLRRGHPGAEIVEMPLSDGGEGLLDVLCAPLALSMIEVEAADPLGRPVTARYGLSGDGATAIVEMAQASGLQRLAPGERDPLLTSTLGTGQMLADARRRGARRVVLGIGGSATNDAGIGAAAALGWGFLDAPGQPVAPLGGRMGEIARLVPPGGPPFEQLDVLCDVTNPLHGPTGAAWTYGRQKGGTDASLTLLDDGLRHVADLVGRQLGGPELASIPGAGAAGGLGFGAMAFLGGRLRRGVDVVLDLVGFDEAVRGCDLIVTGEGSIDGQSAQGKLIQGVCARAGGARVIALCGRLSATPEETAAIGLAAAYSINAEIRPLPEMLAATGANLARTAARLVLV